MAGLPQSPQACVCVRMNFAKWQVGKEGRKVINSRGRQRHLGENPFAVSYTLFTFSSNCVQKKTQPIAELHGIMRSHLIFPGLSINKTYAYGVSIYVSQSWDSITKSCNVGLCGVFFP